MAENKLSGIGSIGGIYPMERRVAQDPKMLNPSDQMMPAESETNWFKDLYLDRKGGGGKDFMVPEKYIDILGGDERIDQMNIDAAEQETFERGEGNRL